MVGQKLLRAHRFSWQIHKGDIPEKLHVLHKCDTPACVNPDHLFLGTNGDNMRDKAKKGRATSWESKKTHCPKEHPYPPAKKGLKRKCMVCHRDRQRLASGR